MHKYLFCFAMLLSFHEGFSQSDRVIDSINALIKEVDDPPKLAGLLFLKAKRLHSRNIDNPIPSLVEAQKIYREINDDRSGLEILMFYADVYYRKQNFFLALHYDSLALKTSNEVGIKDYRFNIYSTMARDLSALGRRNDALVAFEHAEENLDEKKQDPYDIANLYNRKGVLYRQILEYEQSLASFDKAIHLAEKHNEKVQLAVIFMNKANTLTSIGRLQEALEYHMKSLAINESIGNKNAILQSYQNIGVLYNKIPDYKKSNEYHQKALNMALSLNRQASIGLSYNSLGINYARQGKFDSAQVFLKKAIAPFRASAGENNLSLVYNNLGRIAIDQGQYSIAIPYLDSARAIREEIGDMEDLGNIYSNLGLSYLRMGDYKKSEFWLNKALSAVKNKGSNDHGEIYKWLSELYKKTGKPEDAISYQEEYSQYLLKLVTEDDYKDFAKIDAQYKVDQKQQELELEKKDRLLLQASNEKNKQYIIGLSIISLLLVLIFVGFVYLYIQRQKFTKDLQQKNERIEYLIREMHHRVKNNLQVVSGLLGIQAHEASNEHTAHALEESKNRLISMALLHKKFYRDDLFHSVSAKSYIDDLTDALLPLSRNNVQIQLHKAIDDIQLDPEQAMPFGLVMNEILTNIAKHAFTDENKSPMVSIRARKNMGKAEISVSDNGKGFMTGWKNMGKKGFGMQLISLMAEQLDGELSVENLSPSGTEIKIVFPLKN